MNPYPSYIDSGVEWIGEIPDDWSIIRGKYLFGNRVDRNHPDEPLLSVTQEQSVVKRDELNNRVWNPDSDVSGYKLVKDGDFVISLRSFEGGIELSKIQGIVSPVYTTMFRKRDIRELYYKYLLKSTSFITELNKITTGIRQGKNISYDDFSNVFIPFPTLNEQKKIGNYINTKTQQIDELIEKTEQKIELLKEKRTSLINHCVTKGLNPNVEMKDSGVEWIGEIPSGWGKKRNKDVLFETKEIVGDSWKDFKLLSLTKKGVILRDIENGKGKFPSSFETYQVVKKEDLIFCLYDIDETPRTIGISNLNGMITSSYKIIKCKPQIHPKFIYYIYLTIDTFKGLRPHYTGLRNVVRTETFMSLPIYIPKNPEQTQIVEYLDKQTQNIDSTIIKETKRSELLKEYRQSLISEVVTGKVDVRDWKE